MEGLGGGIGVRAVQAAPVSELACEPCLQLILQLTDGTRDRRESARILLSAGLQGVFESQQIIRGRLLLLKTPQEPKMVLYEKT